jgi:hypothetical protein
MVVLTSLWPNEPVLVALAGANGELAAVEVDVLQAQAAAFEQAEAGPT